MCCCAPQVNRRYSKLQIALDGVYKVILLLKKKKYAAIKFETGPDGLEREVHALEQRRAVCASTGSRAFLALWPSQHPCTSA